MNRVSPQPGWAEQHPDLWWEHVCNCLSALKNRCPNELARVKAIGIAYQMHGLVLLDRDGKPVRPAIIWCDSRAVQVGEVAFRAIGEDTCLSKLGNSPGNFTAAKLAALDADLRTLPPRPIPVKVETPAVDEWLTWGYDPERSGWNRAEKTLNTKNVSRLRNVWTTQLSTPTELNTLSTVTAPVIASGVSTAQGAKDILYIHGRDDTLFARRWVALHARAFGLQPIDQVMVSSSIQYAPGCWWQCCGLRACTRGFLLCIVLVHR
jgi:hypothetical protein